MGTLYTCSLSKMKDFENIHTKLFIVLKPGAVKAKGLKHRPALAPSKELFDWAQAHKHEENWFLEYEKWFKKDIKERPGLRDAICHLEEQVKKEDILLVCFCPSAEKCHRRLIAEELASRGIPVQIQ